MDTSRCEVDGEVVDSRYSCNAYNETRTVEIFNFLTEAIGGVEEFEITIGEAIINPSTLD